MHPVRIQRKRTAGHNMQAVSRETNGLDCVNVTRPGRWEVFLSLRAGLSAHLIREAFSQISLQHSRVDVWNIRPVLNIEVNLSSSTRYRNYRLAARPCISEFEIHVGSLMTQIDRDKP